jgi:hypothetical protein
MVVGLGLLWWGAVNVLSGGGILWLVSGLVVDGLGIGMAIAPLASTVLSRVSPAHTGAAAGVLTTVQQVENAIGVAVLGIGHPAHSAPIGQQSMRAMAVCPASVVARPPTPATCIALPGRKAGLAERQPRTQCRRST